jgi:hypothetical protein
MGGGWLAVFRSDLFPGSREVGGSFRVGHIAARGRECGHDVAAVGQVPAPAGVDEARGGVEQAVTHGVGFACGPEAAPGQRACLGHGPSGGEAEPPDHVGGCPLHGRFPSPVVESRTSPCT